MDRREFVTLLGGVGVAAGSATVAGANRGRSDHDVPPEVHTVEIESWDGTTLVADLYVPGARTGRYPAIVMVHGSGGTRSDYEVAGEVAARNGYVVLAPDLRGFGDSGGESTIDGPKEVADVLVELDALADGTFSVHGSDATVTAPVRPSRNGPLVGMRGASLGGAIQLLAAAADREWFASMDDLRISTSEHLLSQAPGELDEEFDLEEDPPTTYHGDVPDPDALDEATPNLSLESSPLDAIVPRIPWADLSRAVAPNDVVKGSWLTYLNIPSGGPPGGVPSLWRQAAIALATGYNEFPEKAEEFFARRSPDLAAIARHDVPTLVLEEWNDGYIPPEHGLTVFEGITNAVSDPPPVALTLSPLDGRPFGGKPAHNWSYPWEPGVDESVEAYLETKTLAWFDRFLKNDATRWRDYGFPSISLYQRQYPDVPDRYQHDTWPGWRGLEAFPPTDASRATLDLATASASPHTVIANSVAPTSVRGPTGTFFASPQADSPASSATFEFEATGAVDVASWPEIALTVTPLGDDAVVFAKFELVESEAATGSVIDSQVLPYRLRDAAGERTRIEYDLVPFQRYLEDGDRIRVVLSTTDNGYYNSREAAGVIVHHETTGESLVTVDVVSENGEPFAGNPLPSA